ncbi:hypothetical protein [Denitrobaculum tricleocarpae]|uniref:Uncharacterized protein n=1 Tax=Denitrobaculum tricleocarpae TaxID=2591009 RepID=A0A545U1M2_9PROT|nr:hypothetical protein [Denitrobaculum tricleocarpae]TQV83346.1 hypothetical protein FKG95_01740 [Denitrobaculum tricleocarpae]
MPNSELERVENLSGANTGRNFFDELDDREDCLPPRTRLLQILSDTGDVLEDIENRCSALLSAIENATLPSSDAACLKKRVWHIEDLSVKAAERINGRHDEATP